MIYLVERSSQLDSSTTQLKSQGRNASRFSKRHGRNAGQFPDRDFAANLVDPASGMTESDGTVQLPSLMPSCSDTSRARAILALPEKIITESISDMVLSIEVR